MQKYTKAILAFAGVLLPFLEQIGAALPGFLTLDWLQGIILAATPVLVYYFPNNDPNEPTVVRSPALVGLLALLMASLVMVGCSGTRLAYKSAEGLDDMAKVMAAHYYSLVREANVVAENGKLTGNALRHAQDIVRRTEEPVLAMARAGDAYKMVRSAENEEQLEAAIRSAAVAISTLIDALRAAVSSRVLDRIEKDVGPLVAGGRWLMPQPMIS